MSRPVNPCSFRNICLHSAFFDAKDYPKGILFINEVTNFFEKIASEYLISNNISIKFYADFVKIGLLCAKVNYLIGEKGENISKIQKQLEKVIAKAMSSRGFVFEKRIEISIKEERRLFLDPYLIGCEIGNKIVKGRLSYNKAIMMVIERMVGSGVGNYRIVIKGRLNGAEIASKRVYSKGTIPLNTKSISIKYAQKHIITTYGVLCAKVYLLVK